MRKLGVILLCVVLAVLAWRASRVVPRPVEVQHPWTSASDPFAPAALRARMERLAPLVSEVVGYSIDVARVRIRAADDRLAAERQFARKFPQLLDSNRDEFSADTAVPLTVLKAQWGSLLGVYRSETSLIELFPYQFDSIVPDRIDAVLDIVVAHELAHAWQDQQFGVQADKPGPRKREASFAWNAVIEGSAEFVAKRVANQLGIGATFERMAAERGGESASLPVVRRSWYVWVYREGLKFVEAVNDEWKHASDWERLFREPPWDVFSIERPQEWLDRAHPVAEPLDDWVERFIWCVEGEPSKFPFDRDWHYWPITPSGLQERLARAELADDDPAWSDCRGGLMVVETPARGGLADADTEIRIWRLGSPARAQAARATLEQAAARRGAGAWSRDAFVEYSGATRRRTGAGGATVYSQTGMDRETGQVEEAICALDVQGPLLLEAVASRVGAAPALLELLETMQQAITDADAIDRARAGSKQGPWGALADLRSSGDVGATLATDAPPIVRDETVAYVLSRPGGEQEIRIWLRLRPADAGAFLAALVPAAGDDPWSATERGEAIVAALIHKDADVRRFALGRLGRGDLAVRPFALEVVPLIRAASRDPQADVRALAIHASDALASERVLGREQIDLLLSDRSPLVRASLASSPGMLTAGDIELLRADDSGMVRRAVGSSRAQSRGGFSPSFPRGMRWTRNPETDMQRAADLEFLWSMIRDDESEEQRAARLARLRKLLGSRDDSVRMSAIVSV